MCLLMFMILKIFYIVDKFENLIESICVWLCLWFWQCIWYCWLAWKFDSVHMCLVMMVVLTMPLILLIRLKIYRLHMCLIMFVILTIHLILKTRLFIWQSTCVWSCLRIWQCIWRERRKFPTLSRCPCSYKRGKGRQARSLAARSPCWCCGPHSPWPAGTQTPRWLGWWRRCPGKIIRCFLAHYSQIFPEIILIFTFVNPSHGQSVTHPDHVECKVVCYQAMHALLNVTLYIYVWLPWFYPLVASECKFNASFVDHRKTSVKVLNFQSVGRLICQSG